MIFIIYLSVLLTQVLLDSLTAKLSALPPLNMQDNSSLLIKLLLRVRVSGVMANISVNLSKSAKKSPPVLSSMMELCPEEDEAKEGGVRGL